LSLNQIKHQFQLAYADEYGPGMQRQQTVTKLHCRISYRVS